MENYSLADIKAVVDGDDDRDGAWGGSGLLWIVLIFLFFLGFSGNGGLFGGNNNGFGNVNRDVLETASETQKEILKSNYDTLLGFKDSQHQLQLCCCDLKNSIHSEGEATRALIQENTITNLRERLGVADNAITIQTISKNILDQLQPVAKPAYVTCSPYFSYPFNGCGSTGGFGNI